MRFDGSLKESALQARTSRQRKTVYGCHIEHLLFSHIQKYSLRLESKCVKSYGVQHCNVVTGFKQVES